MRDTSNLRDLYGPPAMTLEVDVWGFGDTGVHRALLVFICNNWHHNRYPDDGLCWSDSIWMLNSFDDALWSGWLGRRQFVYIIVSWVLK